MPSASFEIRVPRAPGVTAGGVRKLWELAHREGAAEGESACEFSFVREGGVLTCHWNVPKKLAPFLVQQAYALFPDAEIRPAQDPLAGVRPRVRLALESGFSAKFRDDRDADSAAADPVDALLAPLAGGFPGASAGLRIVFSPLDEFPGADTAAELAAGPRAYADFAPAAPAPSAGPGFSWKGAALKAALWSVRALWRPVGFVLGVRRRPAPAPEPQDSLWENSGARAAKQGSPLFAVNLELVGAPGADPAAFAAWSVEAVRALNALVAGNDARFFAPAPAVADAAAVFEDGWFMPFTAAELAFLARVPGPHSKTPGLARVEARSFEPPAELPAADLPGGVQIAAAFFRGQYKPFGLAADDRRRHVYVVGKTGMGKTTFLENMLLADVESGRGAGVIDPHGDMAEALIARIPKSRTNDLVIFDPADAQWPVGLNLLELPDPRMAPVVASGVLGVFKKMFSESWGPRLEHVLRNALLTLLSQPGHTLLSVPLILTDARFRARVLGKLSDPVLSRFWESEFPQIAGTRSSDALGPILNKVGQFLSNPVVRNVVGQPKSGFTPRWVMDHGKILVANLSKGRLGEDASALLGALLVTKFQIDAMSRAVVPENERRDFCLYVDEFQNFATDSFAAVLSEARKYRLGLVLAHQYVEQVAKPVRDAVFGNVGTLVAFQVGYPDARELAPFFGEGSVTPDDLVHVPKHEAYVKLISNGVPLRPLRARMFPPRPAPDRAADVETLKKVNRDKFARPRDFVEGKIAQLHQE